MFVTNLNVCARLIYALFQIPKFAFSEMWSDLFRAFPREPRNLLAADRCSASQRRSLTASAVHEHMRPVRWRAVQKES